MTAVVFISISINKDIGSQWFGKKKIVMVTAGRLDSFEFDVFVFFGGLALVSIFSEENSGSYGWFYG